MPELAEVEFNRKEWGPGLGDRVLRLRIHPQARVFNGVRPQSLAKHLSGAVLQGSEARGKQMVFRFAGGIWLGLHLGMTGRLRVEGPGWRPSKYDHLVLYQRRRALVFSDMRQFGRVRFHLGAEPPDWWNRYPPALTSNSFTLARMNGFLRKHPRLPLKAVLLLQHGFPGVGNWMADEILWRARLVPALPVSRLQPTDARRLHRQVRFVCREALRHIGPTYSELPQGWLFHQRWGRDGHCPRDGTALNRATIGGRTTAWCPTCQDNTREG